MTRNETKSGRVCVQDWMPKVVTVTVLDPGAVAPCFWTLLKGDSCREKEGFRRTTGGGPRDGSHVRASGGVGGASCGGLSNLRMRASPLVNLTPFFTIYRLFGIVGFRTLFLARNTRFGVVPSKYTPFFTIYRLFGIVGKRTLFSCHI